MSPEILKKLSITGSLASLASLGLAIFDTLPEGWTPWVLGSVLAISNVLWFMYAGIRSSWFKTAEKLQGKLDEAQNREREAASELQRVSSACENFERAVESGLRWRTNRATVRIDPEANVYTLVFEKEFEVIADVSPHFIPRQFYCNKILEDANEARLFYENNTPTWDSLNVTASLEFQRPTDERLHRIDSLPVEPITNESYYIPFNIQMKQDSGATLDLVKGTIATLQYRYSVSASLWGSYLNRTLSVWAEPGSVRIELPNHQKYRRLDFTLYRLPPDDRPAFINSFQLSEFSGDTAALEVPLPENGDHKFRLSWDSESIMGIPNTPLVPDASMMTDY